jgi:hypothetical protein
MPTTGITHSEKARKAIKSGEYGFGKNPYARTPAFHQGTVG